MASHIYIRLGRWDLAANQNAQAIHTDDQFISERHPTGVYPTGYYTHNFHVMWYALNMMGRSEEAVRAARQVTNKVSAEAVKKTPRIRDLSPTLLYTLARFSQWDEYPAPAGAGQRPTLHHRDVALRAGTGIYG